MGELNGVGRGLPKGQHYAEKFAIYSALGTPRVDLQRWRLKVGGLVDRRLELTYDELLNSTLMVRMVRDFHCVTRWSVRDAEWEGISLGKLLGRAGVRADAKVVMFFSLDGYTAPIPLEDATAKDTLVALKLNGQPLTPEQGFPARPVIPHLYAWKSAKWLTRIELLAKYRDGYWEKYGYHERGDVWGEERLKTEAESQRSVFAPSPTP